MSQSTTAVASNIPQPPALVQQIGFLHLRISDLASQLNNVMKVMADENAVLRKENADLKTQLQTASQQTSSSQ